MTDPSALLSSLSLTLPVPLTGSLITALKKSDQDQWPLLRSQLIQECPYALQADLITVFQWIKAGLFTGPALALALETSIKTQRNKHRDQELELVWTGPDSGVATRKTAQVVQEVIRAAKKELWVLSFTIRDISELQASLLEAIARGVSLHFILEDKAEQNKNISMGQQSILSLNKLGLEVNHNLKIYIWPDDQRTHRQNWKNKQFYLADSLHAKAMLADQNKVFVTSANLTHAALNQNMELGVLITGGTQPRLLHTHLLGLLDRDVLLPFRKQPTEIDPTD